MPKKKANQKARFSMLGVVGFFGFVLIVLYGLNSFISLKEQATPARPLPEVTPGPQSELSEPVLQKNIDGTQTYISKTGYSLILPPNYLPMKSQNAGKEHFENGNCQIVFTINGMHTLGIQIVPYAGESLKEVYSSLYPYNQGYDLTYEELTVAGKKSLLAEAGPIGDSGSGTAIVVPFNDYALIVDVSYLGKDSDQVKTIIKGIMAEELDISQCGQ